MVRAQKDNNGVNTMIALSNADGSTILNVSANASSNLLMVEDGTSGSDLSGDNAAHDENYVTTLMAVSSADGVTPVPIYLNSSSKGLLVKST